MDERGRALCGVAGPRVTRRDSMGHVLPRSPKLRMPYVDVAVLVAALSARWSDRDTAAFLWCGSYRRGAPIIGDLDLAVRVVDAEHRHFIEEWFRDDYASIVMSRKPNLDVRAFTRTEWPTGTLYLTGPMEWNLYCRAAAKRKGWRLNEYGLWASEGTPARSYRLTDATGHVPTTEKDVCRMLGIGYLPPTKRQRFKGWGT